MWTKWCLKDSLTSLFCSTKALNSSMRSLCVAMARPCHDGAIVAACAATDAACAATVASGLLVVAADAAVTMGEGTDVFSWSCAAVRLKGFWLKGLTLKQECSLRPAAIMRHKFLNRVSLAATASLGLYVLFLIPKYRTVRYLKYF